MINVNSKNKSTLDIFSAEATLKSNDSIDSPHKSSVISKAMTYSQISDVYVRGHQTVLPRFRS